VSDQELNWKFVDNQVIESDGIARARQVSHELGVEPVSPAIGAQLAVVTAAINAESIIEIGTGVGVSGLWMLQSARRAVLTSIDIEADYQQHARQAFHEAGYPSARTRLITGRASEVLPRMNERSYDVVVIDADGASVIEYAEHGLRLAKSGGSVLIAHALWKGRVANPARRDDTTSAFRTLLTELGKSAAVAASISPAGDGLLHVVKLTD